MRAQCSPRLLAACMKPNPAMVPSVPQAACCCTCCSRHDLVECASEPNTLAPRMHVHYSRACVSVHACNRAHARRRDGVELPSCVMPECNIDRPIASQRDDARLAHQKIACTAAAFRKQPQLACAIKMQQTQRWSACISRLGGRLRPQLRQHLQHRRQHGAAQLLGSLRAPALQQRRQQAGSRKP